MIQPANKRKIAFIANLDANLAIHATSFIRAVNDALAATPDLTKQILPVWLNDHASEKGGKNSAVEAVRQNVDTIVGHFASAAAESALQVYQSTNIPVFLPAATADHLTVLHKLAYQLCPADSALASALITKMKHDDVSSFQLAGDGSLHARQLSRSILDEAQRQGVEHHEIPKSGNYPICFIGSFENSLRFLENLPKAFNQTIYLTDDAVHPDLASRVPEKLHALIEVIGFAPATDYFTSTDVLENYTSRWQENPGTYYAQTYAATQLALQIITSDDLKLNLSPKSYLTCLGPLSLSTQKLGMPLYSLWHIKGGALTASDIQTIDAKMYGVVS